MPKGNTDFCSPLCKLIGNIKKKENGCWEWKGAKTKNGYGKIRVGKSTYLVHRFAFELFHGVKVKERLVSHTCRNKLCTNPDHLKLKEVNNELQSFNSSANR